MKNKGFTLLELLFVMLIIAVLSITGYFTVVNYMQKAKKGNFINDSKTIIRECDRSFSAEGLNDNIVTVFSSDEDKRHVSLTNNTLKYCVHLSENGKLDNYKLSNGTYYIEGNSADELVSDNIKYGSFNGFNCDYILDSDDVLEEKILPMNISNDALKIIQIASYSFTGLIVLYFLFRSKNSR